MRSQSSGRIAAIALVALVASQLAATATVHAYCLPRAGSEASVDVGPPLPAPAARADDPLHCQGCSSRSDAKQRSLDAASITAWVEAEPPLRLPPPLRVVRRDRLGASRLPARGPPAPV